MLTESLIPLWVKLTYTLFVAVLVPTYWKTYGPTNFLYFCDIALFLGLAAVWLESPLLASMPAVGVVLVQLLGLARFGGGPSGRQFLGGTAGQFPSEAFVSS